MGSSNLKVQIFIGIFFCMMIGNAVFSHAVGRQFITTAREIRAVERMGGDPEEEVNVEDRTLRSANLMVFTNLPFFAALGLIVRAEEPSMGILYWMVLLLGSILLPLFVSLCLYFLVTPPGPPTTMHTGDWSEATTFDDDPLEDDDDRPTNS
ncbi:MAG: hypothetical protein JJU11_14790 [Candidatus Sumerlaeia bacterium]|nr:hypothetical protein [Candidatus Sumerlaeia bacterium]